jgi:3',5'-cyclic AMP phosphodiesterase CpdA
MRPSRVRKIVHLSDLHFGRIDPALPPALAEAVAQEAPDLVVVSGDFTQRAREEEFIAAADFLRTLPQPVLAVPGNHDVPLYDVLRRWLSPLGRYRRHITKDLAPFYQDEEIAVLGVNTARALTFKNGRINKAQVAATLERLQRCGPDVTRIIVTHHPFEQAEPIAGATARPTLGRADMAMAGFLEAEVDLILSGHEHISGVGLTTMNYRLPGRSALLVQAGTATSTRRRHGEANAFNVISIAGALVTIACRIWLPDETRFAAAAVECFRDTDTGWSRMDATAKLIN